MTKNNFKKNKSSRVEGGFCALPFDVLDSQAYLSLPHAAKSLLLEVARQYKGDNNGRLLLSSRHLRSRGWRSSDVISRNKRELLDAKLIYETVMGHRPNKASWFALTWLTLDRIAGYDHGAVEGFRRGSYRSEFLHAKINTVTPLAVELALPIAHSEDECFDLSVA